MALACGKLYEDKKIETFPILDYLAAMSVGVSGTKEVTLDLNYDEDSSALVDMNVVMTGKGGFVEIQGTGGGSSLSLDALQDMLLKAERGIEKLFSIQRCSLGQM